MLDAGEMSWEMEGGGGRSRSSGGEGRKAGGGERKFVWFSGGDRPGGGGKFW